MSIDGVRMLGSLFGSISAVRPGSINSNLHIPMYRELKHKDFLYDVVGKMRFKETIVDWHLKSDEKRELLVNFNSENYGTKKPNNLDLLENNLLGYVFYVQVVNSLGRAGYFDKTAEKVHSFLDIEKAWKKLERESRYKR